MSQSHILLVDDDAGLTEAVQAVLESRGSQVTHHDDGEVALKAAEDGDFDLVLTDYRMPGMGGMQLLESLQESAPRLPVIMMTAFSTTDRAIEATKKGAFDYLIKPFEMPELLDLEQMITDESFRQDLFFRLNASVINLPPLRDRTDDIPALVNYFLAKYSREFQTETPSIHKDALACLSKQQWPGNVRQLENVVRRALIDARGFTITQRMVEDSMAVSPAALDDKGDQGSLATHVQNRLMAASKGDLPDGAFAALSADLEEELYRQAVALSHGN
ncbi:response regulator, partial [bacterium]|nr:response regulator [bacterium]